MSYPQSPKTAFAVHPPLTPGTPPVFLVIDLFCGFGGVTRGFSQAQAFGHNVARVIACVNHDLNAIASHRKNHPEVAHFQEDIQRMNLAELREIVRYWQALYPGAYLVLWASPDCTHHSKAKGGESRNADSRTLARHLRRYIRVLNPDYVMVENVTDFRSWGPLVIKVERHRVKIGDRSFLAESCPLKVNKATGELGPTWVPEKRTRARDFLRWIESLKRCGYVYDDRDMNAADYGAFTSRLRYYGIFAKPGLPITWPKPSHAKKPTKNGLFGDLRPWNAVREKLDLNDPGESIFTRKKRPEEKTLERIYAGLVKFVAKGDIGFMQQYFSGEPTGKVQSLETACPTITTRDHNGAVFITKWRGHGKNGFSATANSVDAPCPTVTTMNHLGVVQAEFLVQTYAVSSVSDGTYPVDGPARTITTRDAHNLVQAEFLSQRNGGDPMHRVSSVEEPARTLTTTGGNLDLVQAEFLMQSNGGDPASKVVSVNGPARTITTNDNQTLVQPEFLHSYYGNGGTHSLDDPSATLTTRDRLALVESEFFIDKYYTGGKSGSKHQNQSINVPAGSLTSRPKLYLVEAQFLADFRFNNTGRSLNEPGPTLLTGNHQYLISTAFDNAPTALDQPARTITANRHYPYLISAENGEVCIVLYPDDSPALRRIKLFMAAFGIVDIRMRMLRIKELLRIQGFPEDYKMVGTQEEAKKFIGNSVEPNQVKAWVEALALPLLETQIFAAA